MRAAGINFTRGNDIELSIVLPCLNEEETVGECISDCYRVLDEMGIDSEVLVVDNGSQDSSVDVIKNSRASLYIEHKKGYGSALLRGFREAAGKYIIMLDCDGTYDPSQIKLVWQLLNNDYDFVNGSRTAGNIEKNAMPFLHRWIGVPILGWLVRMVSGSSLSDAHCGIRGFNTKALDVYKLQSHGMELASEMIIKAARANLPTSEFPANYRCRIGFSKLNTFRDGWRHLRLIIGYSPSHFFLIPGGCLALLGLLFNLFLFTGPKYVNGFMLDYHLMFPASLITFLGIEFALLGIYGKVHALSQGIIHGDKLYSWGEKNFSMERGLLVGGAISILGLIVTVYVFLSWFSHGLSFPGHQMIRQGILALFLIVTGVQVIFGTLLVGLFPPMVDED